MNNQSVSNRIVTPEVRKKVVSLKASGLHLSNISKEINRSKSVVSRLLKLYEENKTFHSTSKPGRPRITTKREDRAMKRYIDKDPFETATGIVRQIKSFYDKDVSRFTVSRRLNDFELKALSPATKPLSSKKNRDARWIYADTHVIWQDHDWDRVHFSDKSKFNLVGSDGRQFVSRVSGDRLNP